MGTFMGRVLGGIMGKGINRLSVLAVGRTKKDGLYADGGNLYLQVRGDGKYKSWLFRYMRHGGSHDIGLGPIHDFTLADARTKAQRLRVMLKEGIDPLEAKKNQVEAARQAASKGTTFEACAREYIEAHKDSWKQKRHAKQWEQALTKHAYEKIGKLPVRNIDTENVLSVLQPVWKEKTETAKRLRGRIESILDWAKVKGFRHGENPARWRGHLSNMLAKPSKLQKVEHFAALPYAEIYGFLRTLKEHEGDGVKALKLVIHTAKRTTEVLEAQWDEFDFKNKVWTIPAERMKGEIEHRVPLTELALAVLKEIKAEREEETPAGAKLNPYLFPSPQRNKTTLSNAAMAALLKRMGRLDITVHGFRSTFKDWAAEQTDYADEVSEAALAHVLKDKVKAAYLRSDFFEKRRHQLEDWAKYCQSESKQ